MMEIDAEKRKKWVKDNLPKCYESIVDTLGQDWTFLTLGEPTDDNRYWYAAKSQWDHETEEMRSKGFLQYYMEEERLPGKRQWVGKTWAFWPFGKVAVALIVFDNVYWFAVSNDTIKTMAEAADWGALDK